MLKAAHKIYLVMSLILGVLIIYVLLFYIIKLIRPSFLVSNDGPIGTYNMVMYPLRYLDAYHGDSLRFSNGPAAFDGIMESGGKIFYIREGMTFSSYAGNDKVINKCKLLKMGDAVRLRISGSLESDENFRNYFQTLIIDIQTDP